MERKRSPYEKIMYYAVYLVFEGLSFRGCSRVIEPFVKRSHVVVWQCCQGIGSYEKMHKIFRPGRERVKILAIDETAVKVGSSDAISS